MKFVELILHYLPLQKIENKEKKVYYKSISENQMLFTIINNKISLINKAVINIID